jgi:hypothetical protein
LAAAYYFGVRLRRIHAEDQDTPLGGGHAELEEHVRYLNRRLHFYFIWNPEVHHESMQFEWRRARKKTKTWSLSADKCIQRTLREHQDLLSEFESLMAGTEATLGATGLQARRMTDQEMFLEVKRALQPLGDDRRLYKQGLAYESARSQAARRRIPVRL